MNTTNLPPLPIAAVDEHNLQGGRLLYSRDQMQAYARAAILQERERWQQDALRYRWLRDRGARFLREGDTFTDEEVDTAMNADARAAAIREGGK